MKVTLKKEDKIKGEQTKKSPLGFSLTCFLFGSFVPLVRRDLKLFFIILGLKTSIFYLMLTILLTITPILQPLDNKDNIIVGWVIIIGFIIIVPVMNVFLGFKYNKFSLISRMESGFRPVVLDEINLIKDKYPTVTYRFRLSGEDIEIDELDKKNKKNKKILLIRDDEIKGREKKLAPVGVSWTFLIFGPIVSIYRGDWKCFFTIIGAVMGLDILANLLYQIGIDLTFLNLGNGIGVALAIFYNQFSLMIRLKEGFRPVDLEGKNLVKVKYPKLAEKFNI